MLTRLARIARAVSLPLVFGGCDFTAPRADVALVLTAEGQAILANDVVPPRVLCGVTVTAEAVGDDGARVEFAGLSVDLFVGLDDEAPVETFVASDAEVASWYGSESLEAGGTAAMILDVEYGLPFAGTLRQDYTADGDGRVAETAFQCGPAAAAGPAPHGLAVTVPGQMTPGELVHFGYSGTAPAGTWSAALRITGAMTAEVPVAVEPGAQILSGSAEVWVSWEAQLGEPLWVRLAVTDVAGRTAVSSLTESLPLEDTDPPAFQLRPICPATTNPCPLIAGRTFALDGWSRDASTHWLILTLGDPPISTDSIRFPPGWNSAPRELWADPSWEGLHPVTGRFVDTLGHETAPVDLGPVVVYPELDAISTAIDLEGPVTDLRIDEARGVIYLARPERNAIARLSLATLATLESIPLPSSAHRIDLSLSGDSLLVVRPAERVVYVVDLTGNAVPSTVVLSALETGFEPEAIRVSSNGRWIIDAGRRLDGTLFEESVILEVDPGGGIQRVLATGRRGYAGTPRIVASGDRRRLVVGPDCARTYEASGILGPCWRADLAKLVADGTGSMFAEPGRLYDAAGAVLHSAVPVAGTVEAVAFAPGGDQLYAAGVYGGIHTVDVESWLPSAFREAPPVNGRMEVGIDGSYALLWGSHSPIIRVGLDIAP